MSGNDPWSGWKSDVPESGVGSAIIKDPGEARRLARRMAGQDEKRVLFNCVQCGWEKTLEFEDDEIVALGGSPRNYTGPCPGCSGQTLLPKDEMFGGEKSVMEMAADHRKQEYGEAADIFLDKAAQKLGEVLAGGGAAPAPAADATDEASPDAPAWMRKKP